MKPFNHFILCCPLLLLHSVFPSIRVFSNESVLRPRWPKYWSFSISPSNEYSGLISFRFDLNHSFDWFDLLAVEETLKSLLQYHGTKASIFQHSALFMVQLWHPLEKEMATHSSNLAWRNPWTEEPDRLQSTGLERVKHDWGANLISMPLFPNAFCRPPCGVTLRGKPTIHGLKKNTKSLLPCAVSWNSAGCWGPFYIDGNGQGSCPQKQALHPEPSKETPMKISPVQSEQRHFQSKGQSGCLNWIAMERTLFQD